MALPLGWLTDKCVFGEGDSNLEYTCSSTETQTVFTVKLRQVQNSQHGERWQWKISDLTFSSITEIYVQVPTTSVKLTSPAVSQVSVVESVPYKFMCGTSAGRPEATVQWYKRRSNETEIIVGGGNTEIEQTGTMLVTKSTLHYAATKTDDGYQIYCKANSTGSSIVISTLKPVMTVLYPPMISPFQNRHIIASSHLTVKCATIPGNPSQTSFRWTRNIDNWSQDGETLILPSVTKADAADYTCTAWNVMTPTGGYDVDGTDKETFTINILYPPMISPFQNRHIIASSHLTVKCATIPGNPSQTSFRWTRNINNWSQDGETLILPSVTKADAADYTCTAWNVMTPTGGYDVDGTDKETFTVNILYPPVISTLQNRDIIALSSLTVQCTTTPGNPSQTSFRWTRSTDNWSQDGITMKLPNATKADAADYTCTASNVMTPTVGSAVDGTDTENFTINVLYIPSKPRLFEKVDVLNAPTVVWEGGYNGGYQQLFIIEVTPAETDEWVEIMSVNELKHKLPNGLYIAELVGLDPGYYKARLLSSNNVGKSGTSELPSLIMVSQRNEPSSDHSQEAAQPSPGAVAAGVIAGIVAVVIAAVIFYVIRLRRGHLYQKDKGKADQAGSQENHQKARERNENDNNIISSSASSDAISDETRNVYEQLDPTLRKDNVYNEMDQTKGQQKQDARTEYVNLNL